MKKTINYVLRETIDNYESRITSFTDWANGSEAQAAKVIREKFLLHSRKVIKDKINIIDIGCGPGRDIIEFNKESDCQAIGLEPSEGFCEYAKKEGLTVYNCDIVNPTNEIFENKINGVFCLASLFHITLSDLPKVIQNINLFITVPCVMMTSFPKCNSTNEFKMSDGRWASQLSEEDHEKLLNDGGFNVVEKFDSKIYSGKWSIFISQKI
jgi:SAM-dependent methyltransferase